MFREPRARLCSQSMRTSPGEFCCIAHRSPSLTNVHGKWRNMILVINLFLQHSHTAKISRSNGERRCLYARGEITRAKAPALFITVIVLKKKRYFSSPRSATRFALGAAKPHGAEKYARLGNSKLGNIALLYAVEHLMADSA